MFLLSPFLYTGNIMDNFQLSGNLRCCSEMLNKIARTGLIASQHLFNTQDGIPSGLSAVEYFILFIAEATCRTVMRLIASSQTLSGVSLQAIYTWESVDAVSLNAFWKCLANRLHLLRSEEAKASPKNISVGRPVSLRLDFTKFQNCFGFFRKFSCIREV